MAHPISLNNYQFAFNDFLFGGAGSPYQIQSIDGLEAIPNLRVQDSDRGFNDGSYTGRDFFDARNVTMVINVFADATPHSASQNMQTFRNSVIPQSSGTGLLQFQLGADRTIQWLNARVRKVSMIIDPDYTYGKGQIVLDFFCPDPVIYGGVPGTPITGAIAISAATLAITNSGNTTTYPLITISGATTSLVITNSTLAKSFTAKYSTIAGDTVIIDLYNKWVTYNGITSRSFMAANSLWFGGSAGADTFTATWTGAGTLALSWYNAWI